MYNFKNRYSIQWTCFGQALGPGVTRDVTLGDMVSGLAGMTAINVAQTIDLDWLSFTMRSDQNLNLLIDTGQDSGTMTNWITFAYVAPAPRTVYDMAAPYGGAGSNGRLGLGCAFLRLRLNNPGAANAVTLEFFGRAWHD